MNSPFKTVVTALAAISVTVGLTGCSSAQEFADGAADALGVASLYGACAILESTPYGEDLIRQLPVIIDFAESAVAQDAKWEKFLTSLKDVEKQATVAKDGAAAAASLADAVAVCVANK
jgi:hypothetical protein